MALMEARGSGQPRPDKARMRDPVLVLLLTVAACAFWLGVVFVAIAGRAHAGGTHVKPGEKTRVFVMAGFTPECAFKGYPAIQVDKAPMKGAVETADGADTTIQYSLSGKCIGTPVKGTAIYYVPAAGQSGEDTFTVSGRLGHGEPATRTFSVIIDENGKAE